MTTLKTLALGGALLTLAACVDVPEDKSDDLGVNSHDVSTMVAGIWIDPDGCDHWIIDDGVEGYLSSRNTPDGRPVCSGVAEPTQIVGPFRSGSLITDPL